MKDWNILKLVCQAAGVHPKPQKIYVSGWSWKMSSPQVTVLTKQIVEYRLYEGTLWNVWKNSWQSFPFALFIFAGC